MKVTRITPPKEIFDQLNMLLTADELYLEEHSEWLKENNIQYNEVLNEIIGILKRKTRDQEKMFNLNFKIESLQKLIDNPYVESVHLSEEMNRYLKIYHVITVITKSLMFWKWDIGQFKIEWSTDEIFPKISKIGDIIKHHSRIDYVKVLLYPYKESEFLKPCIYQHPHIRENGACFGDATNLIKTFWSDYAKGFNYCIQYLLTYSRSGAYVKLPYYLAGLGYIEDANILLKKEVENARYVIRYIKKGKLYNNLNEEITGRDLKEWGCTAKKTTKKEIIKSIEESRQIKARRAIEQNIRYHPNIHDGFVGHYKKEFPYVCDKCGIGLRINGDYKTIHLSYGANRYCNECALIHAVKCDSCGAYYEPDLIYHYTNMNLCRSCNRTYKECKICGKVYEKYIPDYNGACEECTFKSNFSIFNIPEPKVRVIRVIPNDPHS